MCGDWVLSSQRKEAAIYIFRRGQKSPHIKCRLAEPIGPVLISPDGSYCFAGGTSGTLYAWEVWSGQLIRTWHGHHKTVRCLGLTDDASFLVSGGDDAVLSVWNVGDILDSDDGRMVVRERHSWADHSQAVTALHVGRGGSEGVFTLHRLTARREFTRYFQGSSSSRCRAPRF